MLSVVRGPPSVAWGFGAPNDRRDFPLSNTYTYNLNGAGVHAYTIDTGILFGFTSGWPVQADYDGDGLTDVPIFRPGGCQ